MDQFAGVAASFGMRGTRASHRLSLLVPLFYEEDSVAAPVAQVRTALEAIANRPLLMLGVLLALIGIQFVCTGIVTELRARTWWAALITAVVAALWVQVLKQVVSMPRPFAVLPPDLIFQSGPAFRALCTGTIRCSSPANCSAWRSTCPTWA